MDSASSAMGAGVSIVLISPEGVKVEHSFKLGFRASNNEAEYEALIVGLRAVLSLGATNLEVYSDSRLVVSQVEGTFEAKDSRMVNYLKLVKKMMGKLQKIRLVQISQGQNRHADSLATLASSLTDKMPWLIEVEVIKEPSINPKVSVLAIVLFKPSWMDPIIKFLAENRLPSESKEADKVRRIATRFWLFGDCKLYRRSFGGPYLLYLHPNIVNEFLTELHEGICGNHVRGQSLAH